MGYNPNKNRTDETVKDKLLPLQPGAGDAQTGDKAEKDNIIPPTETGEEAIKRLWSSAADSTKRIAADAKTETVTLPRIGHVDEEAQRRMLEQLNAAAGEQAEKRIDYATAQGTAELERAEADAAEKFQTQRNRISADELRALDDQALYAEARGDRGGIGQAQYGAIRNTAAVNRMAVDREQTKLSTDTARQIADLRAKGEFEKADKLLELTQSHLSELMTLRRWAEETNMSADEFNAKLAQWEADYALEARKYSTDAELSAAKLTGALSDGALTLEGLEAHREQLIKAGEAMLAAGLVPTEAQLEAMGWTKEQYLAWAEGRGNAAAAEETARRTGPIYIRNSQGELVRVTKRQYREYLASRQ